MIDTIVARARGLFLEPVETLRQSKNDEPRAVFTYFGALLLVYAVLSSLVTPVFGIVADLIMTVIAGFIGMLVFAAWVHLWVYIVGGREGVMQTAKALFYGSTPGLLLGWIPFVGIIFSLWSLVLYVLGVRELQGISTARAVIAVAIGVIVPLVLIVLLAAALFINSVVTVTPVQM